MAKIAMNTFCICYLHIDPLHRTFFYGHDPRLPTELCMNVVMDRSQIDLNSHKCEVISQMVEAWELARRHVKKAKQKQKNKIMFTTSRIFSWSQSIHFNAKCSQLQGLHVQVCQALSRTISSGSGP